MIVEAGHYALVLALVLSLLQASLPLIGAARGDGRLMAMGPSLAGAQLLLIAAAFGALIAAYVQSDFSVANVFRVTPDRGLIEVPDSGGTSPRQWEDENRRLESVYADGCYASITGDMFG